MIEILRNIFILIRIYWIIKCMAMGDTALINEIAYIYIYIYLPYCHSYFFFILSFSLSQEFSMAHIPKRKKEKWARRSRSERLLNTLNEAQLNIVQLVCWHCHISRTRNRHFNMIYSIVRFFAVSISFSLSFALHDLIYDDFPQWNPLDSLLVFFFFISVCKFLNRNDLT